ncbi:DUF3103 family protein [Pseudoalteromonas luteoviolacea]|uniref:DUF3103 domain-containing protein n=1 Tax=Pseudoalteromonas luteoviolacea S4054 TaxID=1129367 RepID=A0A0F6AID3_9GAMM|nr:DUF3103 family protein [Pseudoalteromonas luteoviolacea]AOT09914.1 hypothetical protein S4054249_19735 [Pseudoalteromonas luteoviolacea]AOT14825.1 hypothetical protein S40542_19705 [Pseudoalteromonas luteoviolacea]AOT19741.1 hypothetical protein S4054_19710 [Pseudoalteromonas luteoviolacea]KKE85234.1 hypothetical protein N479_05735 [Pseudoalteromonas luteoviolacea S4054]KZN64004.1 hypothetical protein N481_02980 [Pseudoalteromonas luteoviolacea S4047-1]
MHTLLKFAAWAVVLTLHSGQVDAQPTEAADDLSASLQSIDLYNTASFQVVDIKRVVAKAVAREIKHKQQSWQQQLNSFNKLNLAQLSLSRDTMSLGIQANRLTRQLKGLSSYGQQVFQLRLADSAMLDAWQGGQLPLIAFSPRGEDTTWLHVEAFDADGQLHLLDATQMPQRPVLIVELDKQVVHKEGIAVMRKVFNQHFSKAQSILETDALDTIDIQSAISTSVINHIRLNDDKEPWVSGAAEIYAIVNGVSPSRDEPVLDIVDLPYLDNDGQDYSPNQILIHWERYRWQAADVLLMEHDDNTNYQELAVAFLDVVTQAMKLIPNPKVQGYAIIPQLTNELIKAMPSHWFSNDDDYVDVFYTLFENRRYSNLMGASNNAKMTLSPLTIEPR